MLSTLFDLFKDGKAILECDLPKYLSEEEDFPTERYFDVSPSEDS